LKQLVREAVEISKELDGVIFIGAIAIYFHTKIMRESQDIDFAIVKPITNEELENKGYKTIQEGRKEITRTPRGVKIDIYRHDVSKIPISMIRDTAAEIQEGKATIRVIGLEALLVAKHRAQRDQDVEDIRELVRRKHRQIRHDVLRQITESDAEYSSILTTINFFKDR
jgi:predicted nucleotidyltransferase